MDGARSYVPRPRHDRILRFLKFQPLIALLGVTGLAALLMSPTFEIGYLSDDMLVSTTPGLVRWYPQGLTGVVLRDIHLSMSEGRFYPLVWVPFRVVFNTFQEITQYRAYICTLVVFDVAIFFLLVRKLFGDARFACLAACLTLMLMQFRAYHDPILSFYGLLQLVAAGTFLSLLALDRYLDGRGRGWLVASVVLYLSVMLLYETSYPFFVFHAALIWRREPRWGDRLRAIWPFLRVFTFCLAMSLLLRWLSRGSLSGTAFKYRMNLAPLDVLLAMTKQAAGALPLSHFLTDPTGLFASMKGLGGLFSWTGRADAWAAAAVTTALSCLGLGLGPREDDTDTRRGGGGEFLPLVLGGLIAVLPGLSISLTERYQREVSFSGRPYLPVYIQYFGMGLVLATAIRGITRRWPVVKFARVARVGLAAAVALTTVVTFQANSLMAISLVAMPGSCEFNPNTAIVGGVWHYPRMNMQVALRSGLLDPVPEGSRLLVANAYGMDYEGHYFYAMHASKRLETVTPPSRATVPPAAKPTFELRDAWFWKKVGYAVLSRPDGGPPFRLFVRRPGLFRPGRPPEFLVVGRASGGGAADRYLKPAPTLRLLRSGPDWGLFSLDSEVGRVAPESLTVIFDPTEIVRQIPAVERSGGLAR
jgi:hypothetical protein